jgi:hypothetical protein
MPKHTGVIDHYAEAGITKLFHRQHDGDWVYETQQSGEALQQIADANKEAQNHCNPWNAEKDMRLDARIPLIYRQKWIDLYGVDFLSPDPDVQKRVDRILDDPEWRWMRTSTAKVYK